MRKLLILLIIGCATYANGQFIDPAQSATMAKMLAVLKTMKSTMDDSADELRALKDVYNKANDVNKFIDLGLAARKAIDMLVCLNEQTNELREMQRLYGPHSNVFSGFMECQQSIYYGVIDVDYESIRTNIKSAFDFSSDIQFIDRIRAIESALTKIQEVHHKTVIVEQSLVEELMKEYEARMKKEWVQKLQKI